ncbi:MAG: 50S ribosomal protein L1 [Candidatus Kerfeldbacteria bacterium]
MARSKRYKEASGSIDATTQYSLEEGIKKVKENPVKFDAGIELHIRLGIDPSKSEQLVRGTVVLPHGSGKTKRVAAFVSPDKEAEAKEAGADIIGGDAVIEEIKTTGKCDFDVAVATPDMMKKLGPIAKTLGQQGLMPNPKTETVGPDVKKMVTELKGGKIAYRCDDGGNIHMLIGRVSFEDSALSENIQTVLESVAKVRPSEAKGTFMTAVYLSPSMGPSIKITVE